MSPRSLELLAVPPGVDVEKAAATILNYLTAYQAMTRAVPLARGQSAFVYGFAGGLGGAMRQVAQQMGVRLYGTASVSRLAEAGDGATAFDRSDPAWPEAARRQCPDGFDAVFDPLGRASLNRSYGLVSRRGSLVMMGAASSVQGARSPPRPGGDARPLRLAEAAPRLAACPDISRSGTEQGLGTLPARARNAVPVARGGQDRPPRSCGAAAGGRAKGAGDARTRPSEWQDCSKSLTLSGLPAIRPPSGSAPMSPPTPNPPVSRRALISSIGGAALASKLRAQGGSGDGPAPSKAAYMKGWNAAERVELWPNGAPGASTFRRDLASVEADPAHVLAIDRPALHVFRSPRPNGQGLLVMPGGAYRFVSVDNEGMDVADRLNPAGITVFVLTYRLPGEGWAQRADVPLQDAQRAMRLIRSRADAFGIRPDRLAALGFSAGGHLATSLATDHASRLYDAVDAADGLSAKPFAVGLIYPLILMQPPFTHSESRANLLGPGPSAGAEIARTPSLHVGPDTPPLFLAHAMDDDAVPVENSLAMIQSCRAQRRPVEAHLFENGRHAFGVGRPGTPGAFWPEQFSAWLENLGATPST